VRVCVYVCVCVRVCVYVCIYMYISPTPNPNPIPKARTPNPDCIAAGRYLRTIVRVSHPGAAGPESLTRLRNQ